MLHQARQSPVVFPVQLMRDSPTKPSQIARGRPVLGRLSSNIPAGSPGSALTAAPPPPPPPEMPPTKPVVDRPEAFSTPMQVHVRNPHPRRKDASYNTRYKTQLCLHYERYQFCSLGEDCHFAHGFQELHEAFRHPKFRTRPCRSFYLTGYCPFGVNCFFQHVRQM